MLNTIYFYFTAWRHLKSFTVFSVNFSPKNTHTWREEYEFLCEIEDREIDKSVCICYPCYKQIQRNIDKPRLTHYSLRATPTVCTVTLCVYWMRLRLVL